MISTFTRQSRAYFGKPVMAAALALGGLGAMVAAPVAHAQQQEPELKPSRDFQKAFSPVYSAFQTSNANAEFQEKSKAVRMLQGEARTAGRAELVQMMAAEVSALRAVKSQIANPSDRYFWGNVAIGYGVLTDDPVLQMEGILAEEESGLQTSARKAALSNAKAMILFDRGEYAAARAAFQASIDAGSSDSNLRSNIFVTYVREGNRPQALEYINGLIDEAAATGTPSEDMLVKAFSLANELQVADADDYAINLARFYPNGANWARAIVIVRSDYTDNEAVLDLQRLMVLTDSVQNRPDVTAIIEYADYRKRPQEVLDAIDLGIEKGFLNPSEAFVTETQAEARNQVKLDQAGELASLGRDARAGGAKLPTLTAAGDAYLNYGQPAVAEEIFRLALAKPGADQGKFTTRIGIAQVQQGQFAEAQATFASVVGNWAAIANLWKIYAAQQAG